MFSPLSLKSYWLPEIGTLSRPCHSVYSNHLVMVNGSGIGMQPKISQEHNSGIFVCQLEMKWLFVLRPGGATKSSVDITGL